MANRKGLYVVAFIFLQFFCSAQDIHYSQFFNSPINVNPAQTGVFNGDKRFMASFRDQWRSVPVPWTTFSGFYDTKIYPGKSDDNFWGLGFIFNYDRQGDSRIALSNFNISGTYNLILNKNNVLSFGALLGYASRAFNETTLTWDSQWDGIMFDPSLPSGENFDIHRINFLETGAGINYRYQISERTKIDAGVGAYHLIEPDLNYDPREPTALPRRFSFLVNSSFRVASKFDLLISGVHQIQDAYNISSAVGQIKIYVNEKRGTTTNLYLGAGYRFSQSLFPMIAVEYNDIYASFSYGIDQSDFDIATSGRGGPELHFRYIIKSVKPLGLFKACPIF